MNPSTLRVHHMMAYSQVNGPGKRAVIWLQGCTLACPGCFNPGTHGAGGGKEYPVEQLMDWLATLADSIDGLSISGGEPMQQLPPLVNLLQQVRQKLGLSVLLFTGYTWLEVQKMPAALALIDCVDVLIAGRYVAEQRLANHLIGSSNKTVHLITHTYTLDDLNSIPPAEVVIDPSGAVVLSGIDPLIW